MNKLHPLTQLLTDESMWDNELAQQDDAIIRQYLRERAEWFNNNSLAMMLNDREISRPKLCALLIKSFELTTGRQYE